MSIPIRPAVRVLLINNNKLLLMCVEDFDIHAPGAKKNKRFWCTIGGGIEGSESVQDAALREIYEETGIAPEAVELGPVVWKSEIDLMLKGILTRLAEQFIVAKTQQKDVALHKLTSDEQEVVKKLEWFSLEQIKNSQEIIFPVLLATHLPTILTGNYPKQPVDISK